MEENVWFKPLVWMDYRLALLFAVFIPVTLLIWALYQRSEAVQRLLMIYWRVASLLLIAVYLLIASLQIGLIAAAIARLLIPISLWFWSDINEEINDLPQRSLKLAVTSWRWAVTVYNGIGFVTQIFFLGCAFGGGALEQPSCRVWLEAPWRYKEIFHAGYSTGLLGFLGIVGLIVYVLYLSYFIFVRLGKQGRSAMEQ